MLKFGGLLAIVLSLAASAMARAETPGPTVFAAASMKTALDAIAAAWRAETGHKVVISYGSSGTLAKQIEAGAPADLFISADEKWMDVLARDGRIKPGSRENLLGNTLVLVAPARASAPDMTIDKGFDLAGALGDGKLAVCTVSSCPAGIYGKEALTRLGVWTAVAPKLAEAENVRAALLLVARGEAKYGIVYATDARAEPKVKVVGTFPAGSHASIVYPVALTKQASNPDAASFQAFLRDPASKRILDAQGFTIIGR